MTIESTHGIVMTTTATDEDARRIARSLVEAGLAACVTVVPGARSVYRFKGEISEDRECILLVKTRTARFDEVRRAIREGHPYELPEIVLVPIERADPEYLAWIDGVTG